MTDFQLKQIKLFIADMKDIDSGNASIRDGDVEDSNEGAGGICYRETHTSIATTKNIDQRKNVNHIWTLDDIPIDEGSENDMVSGWR